MKIDELQKFAITLAFLPLIPAFILHKHQMDDVATIVLQIFFVLAITCLVSKKFARNFKDTLAKIGKWLGKNLAIVALFLVYIVAVLPTGLLMKVVKRDRLRLKKQNLQTYWTEYKKSNTDYEYQF